MGRYPWAEVLLLEVLHIVILYPTYQYAYRLAVLAAMICVTARIYQTPEVTDPLTVGYTVGMMYDCVPLGAKTRQYWRY